MTQDKKVELGKAVADLKTFLHDVENLISNDEANFVDFKSLVQKTKKLTDLCEAFSVSGKVTAPAVAQPPTPSGPAKAEHTGDQSKAKPK